MRGHHSHSKNLFSPLFWNLLTKLLITKELEEEGKRRQAKGADQRGRTIPHILMAICDHLLLQYPWCATVIVSLLSQESFSISHVFRYVFPLLPQTNSFSWGQEFLAHAHLAVPLVPTMHLEFAGQLKWPQGFVGLSTTRKQTDMIIWLQKSKKWVSAKFSRKQAI